jgi:hypothetical protein
VTPGKARLAGARERGDADVLRTAGRARARLALTAATAMLAAMGALAACGPLRLGAAAILDSQRISTASLTTQVASLETAYQASKGRIQLRFRLSEAPQQVLGWMVRFQVRDQLAARNHISVSTGESQRALAALAAQARQGGITAPLRDLAVSAGLPPDLLAQLGRYQAIQNVIIARLDGGTLPTSPSALQQLNVRFSHEECLAAKSLHIQISPQYGQMDYRPLAVIPAVPRLSAPSPPTPAPTPAPQLRPPC